MKKILYSMWAKYFVLFLYSSLIYNISFSQFYPENKHFEAGLTLGPSVFLGDLGGNAGIGKDYSLKDVDTRAIRVFGGAYLSYYFSQVVGVRLAANIGSVAGDDAFAPRAKGSTPRRDRNLNFKSGIKELQLMLEIYPTAALEYEPQDVRHKLRPYVFGGIGVFRFNPMGEDPATGNYVALQPLSTEGQGFPEYPNRKPYKLTQFQLPFGVGLKYFVSESVSLSLEVNHRKTPTDYIDDVSTNFIDPISFYSNLSVNEARLAERLANKSPLRNIPASGYSIGSKRGDPAEKDAYFTFNFKLGFRLNNTNAYQRSTRCPTIRF